MDNQNVVAARLGLPFKCGVCSEAHEKADLNNENVCRCFAKVWDSVLMYKTEYFSPAGDKCIRKPTLEFIELHDFNVPKIIHSYPVEQDVFMLAFPMEKAIESLKKKFIDWKDDCIKQQVRLIEEKGELENVKVIDGKLYINGRQRPANYYPIALLMMKNREIALALACTSAPSILDVKWRSLKESAKILITDHFGKEKFTIFASEETGVVQVPDRIYSVREAEKHLRQLYSHEKNMVTLRALFRIADYVIYHDIPRLFLHVYSLYEHRAQLMLQPPLGESIVRYTRLLLNESILSLNKIEDKTKRHLVPTIEACTNAFDALEKAYKSISNNTSNNTIKDNLSQALYWLTQTHKEVVV